MSEKSTKKPVMPNILLACSACGEVLADVIRSVPDADFAWEIYADCPFCGDKSFRQTAKGLLHIGDNDRCAIVDQVIENDNVIHLITAKRGV